MADSVDGLRMLVAKYAENDEIDGESAGGNELQNKVSVYLFVRLS